VPEGIADTTFDSNIFLKEEKIIGNIIFGATTFVKMTLTTQGLFPTLGINYLNHNNTAIMLSVAFYCLLC